MELSGLMDSLFKSTATQDDNITGYLTAFVFSPSSMHEHQHYQRQSTPRRGRFPDAPITLRVAIVTVVSTSHPLSRPRQPILPGVLDTLPQHCGQTTGCYLSHAYGRQPK